MISAWSKGRVHNLVDCHSVGGAATADWCALSVPSNVCLSVKRFRREPGACLIHATIPLMMPPRRRRFDPSRSLSKLRADKYTSTGCWSRWQWMESVSSWSMWGLHRRRRRCRLLLAPFRLITICFEIEWRRIRWTPFREVSCSLLITIYQNIVRCLLHESLLMFEEDAIADRISR